MDIGTGLVKNTILKLDLAYSHSDSKFKYKFNWALTFGIKRKFLLKAKQDVRHIETFDLRITTNSNHLTPVSTRTPFETIQVIMQKNLAWVGQVFFAKL